MNNRWRPLRPVPLCLHSLLREFPIISGQQVYFDVLLEGPFENWPLMHHAALVLHKTRVIMYDMVFYFWAFLQVSILFWCCSLPNLSSWRGEQQLQLPRSKQDFLSVMKHDLHKHFTSWTWKWLREQLLLAWMNCVIILFVNAGMIYSTLCSAVFKMAAIKHFTATFQLFPLVGRNGPKRTGGRVLCILGVSSWIIEIIISLSNRVFFFLQKELPYNIANFNWRPNATQIIIARGGDRETERILNHSPWFRGQKGEETV